MAIKLLFKRDRWLGLRTLCWLSFAVILMIADHRSTKFQHFKSLLSIVVLPIQYVVNWPAQWVTWASTSITTQHQLLEENAELRANQLLLEAKLQKLVALERENAQLLALLQSSLHVGGKFTAAELLAVDMNPLVQQVILNKGSRAGAYVGQPVLDAYGLMGQVIEAGPFTSRVMLISGLQSAVPVQNARNGVRAVAIGTGYQNDLQLLYVPTTADVRAGDILITSGLGGRFPEGYPVGVVKRVTHNAEFRFAVIRVMPSSHIDQSRQVLLVWPENPKVEYLHKIPNKKPLENTVTPAIIEDKKTGNTSTPPIPKDKKTGNTSPTTKDKKIG